MGKLLSVVGWLAWIAMFFYVSFLCFLKVDPSMHNLMFVSGFTCLNVMLMRIAPAFDALDK